MAVRCAGRGGRPAKFSPEQIETQLLVCLATTFPRVMTDSFSKILLCNVFSFLGSNTVD
jgi:hypothetical protein